MVKIQIYVHHGGHFKEDDVVVTYENESITLIRDINDADEVDYFHIRDFHQKLGYPLIVNMYWKMPIFQNLNLALKPLKDDKDLLEMVQWGIRDGGEMHVYYEHGAPSIPELVLPLTCSQEDIAITQEDLPPFSEEDIEPEHNTLKANQDLPPEHNTPQANQHLVPEHNSPLAHQHVPAEHKSPQTNEKNCFQFGEDALEELESIMLSDAFYTEENKGEANMDNRGQRNEENGGQAEENGGEEIGGQTEEIRGQAEEIGGQAEEIAEEIGGQAEENGGQAEENGTSPKPQKRTQKSKRKGGNIVVAEGSDDDQAIGHRGTYECHDREDRNGTDSWISECLKTPVGSDDSDGETEHSRNRHPQFVEGSRFQSVRLMLGMEFANLEIFKQALRDFTIRIGRDIVWIKNDKLRVRAKCKGQPCPWEIYCAWHPVHKSFMIKTFQEEHVCSRVFVNKQASQEWVAGKLVNKLRKNPEMKHGDIVQYLKEKYGIAVEDTKVYRAVQDAKKFIEGGEKEQYGRLWDYCHELLKTNPGSTVKMDTIPRANGEVQFDRVYICLAGCKNGFKAGCRPLIGLDGCFLKGYYGGQLLSAVGQDANNHMWVIAYAIVSVENKDNWKWFLTLLHEDLGDFRKNGWNFISDMQKGLIPALQEVMPGAHHRFCVWHLWQNFGKQWKDKEMRGLLWQCARSTTPNQFDENMEKLKRKCEPAWTYLAKWPKEAWTKAWFSEWPKNDSITNNICETFNSKILGPRKKPIIDMLEGIQTFVMTNITNNKLKLAGRTHVLPPVQKSRLEEEKRESNRWIPRWAGDDPGHKYEVRLHRTNLKCAVNLHEQTCSCRFWQLTGMPCKHAVAAIADKKENPEDYCHAWLTMSSYWATYEYHVNPIPGREFWEKKDFNHVFPPLYRRPGGRPKTNRRKDGRGGREDTVGGPKLKRKLQDFTCSCCGGKNHNKKGCIMKPPQQEAATSGAGLSSPTEDTMDTMPSQPAPTQPSQPTQPAPTQPSQFTPSTQPSQTTQPIPKQPNTTKTRARQPKAPNPTPPQPKAPQPKPSQAKAHQPKPTKPKPSQAKAHQPKPTQPKPTQPKPSQPKPSQPKAHQPKPTQAKANTTQPPQPKHKSISEILDQLGSTTTTTAGITRRDKLPFKRPRLINQAFATPLPLKFKYTESDALKMDSGASAPSAVGVGSSIGASASVPTSVSAAGASTGSSQGAGDGVPGSVGGCTPGVGQVDGGMAFVPNPSCLKL